MQREGSLVPHGVKSLALAAQAEVEPVKHTTLHAMVILVDDLFGYYMHRTPPISGHSKGPGEGCYKGQGEGRTCSHASHSASEPGSGYSISST